MAFELSSPEIREVWKYNTSNGSLYTKTGRPLFGMWRIFIEQIPCESSYNYLAMRGMTCNKDQEIMLSDSEYKAYIEMLRILGHV